MANQSHRALRIHSKGGVELRRTISFLTDLESAYNRIYTLLNIEGDTDILENYSSRRKYTKFDKKLVEPFKYVIKFATESDIKNGIPKDDILYLKSAELSSPGWFDVIGDDGPLGVIRKSIHDHHQRKMEKEVQPHKIRSMKLDNIAQEDQIFFNRLEKCRKLGMPEEDIRELFINFKEKPLNKLNNHVEDELVEDAEFEDVTSDEGHDKNNSDEDE